MKEPTKDNKKLDNITSFLKKAWCADGDVELCSKEEALKCKHQLTFKIKDSKRGVFYVTLHQDLKNNKKTDGPTDKV